MQGQVLQKAVTRLGASNDSPLKLILESGERIVFTEIDFQDGGGPALSSHVWLYDNLTALACVDLRSVAAVRK